MKIKINSRAVHTQKKVRDFKLMVASDFHYNQKFKTETFNSLTQIVASERPDCLAIPGDLVEPSTDDYQQIYNFLKNASSLTKVVVSLGDSDVIMKKDEKKVLCINKNFLNDVEKIENLKLFRDNYYDAYRIDDFVFYGYNPDHNWYINDNRESKLHEFELMGHVIDLEVNKGNYNILLTHDSSPIMRNKESYHHYVIDGIDLTIAGNKYDGILPKTRFYEFEDAALLMSKGVTPNHNIKLLNQFSKPNVDIVKIKTLVKKK